MSERTAGERLSGWGGTTASYAVTRDPSTVEELAGLVRTAGPRGVLPRGLGRSYGDAAQNAGGDVVPPWRPGAPIEVSPDGATATLSGGTSLERALCTLLPLGRTLPVLPGTRFVTVGGAVAADVHGKNHHHDGSFGRWVRRLTLLDGTGEVRELSPTQDAEAFWATVGGMGLTGIVLDATVELPAVTSAYVQVRTRRMPRLDEALDAMERSTARYHVAWVDAFPGRGFGRSVLQEGDPAEAAELTPARQRQPLRYVPRQRLSVPAVPGNMLRPVTVRGFNELWWRKAPNDRTAAASYTSFFHPLDGVGHWNRLYGGRGFVQWQFAVPLSARSLVESSLRRLAAAGVPAYLVVLKRFGAASGAPLSFPMPGWTLAVDLPAGPPQLARLLDELDGEVAAAGGRIYFAKDARLAAALVPAMYPRLDEWRATRERLDPHRRFSSDLARRLRLL